MRPREREYEPPPPESSPTPTPDPAAAPPRTGGNLSSMVVRPSESGGGGGGSDFEPGEVNNRRSPPPHRRDSQPPPLRRRGESPPPDFRRRGSPQSVRRRESPLGFRRRDSPVGFHRRGGSPVGFAPRDSPPAFHRRDSPPAFHRRGGSHSSIHPRSQRFREEPGYLPYAGSFSPPSHRQRLDDSRHDPDLNHPVGPPRFGGGFRGGRGGGRFRDVSPQYGPRTGGRSFGRGRGYSAAQRGSSPFEGEYVHRNDPNLSPREGDWICRICGNLNFARRTHCNNCNKYRFEPGYREPSHSPKRGYFSPPSHGSSPSVPGPPIGRGPRRDINGYRSPPRWDAEDPRDFGTGSPPLRRGGGRFQGPVRRDNRVDYEDDYRGRSKFECPVNDDWDRRDRARDGFIPETRGYERRPLSPRDRWVRDSRERSRSPIGVRATKGPYMGRGRGRGRGDQRYDDIYIGRGHADELNVGRGRGYRRGDDSFIGQGRGHRRGMARGRHNGDMY